MWYHYITPVTQLMVHKIKHLQSTCMICNYSKHSTEHGTFDCRWIFALILLMQLLLAIVFIITQSVMFFMYAVILLALERGKYIYNSVIHS